MAHSPEGLRSIVNDGQVKKLDGVGPDEKVAGAGIEIAGPVEVASVDGGEIVARKDVFIRTSAIGSRIRGGGTVVIGEDGLPGKVEGGTAHGVIGMVVNGPIVGGATLGIEADMDLRARQDKVVEGLEHCEGNVLKILRTLEVDAIDKTQIQAVFRRTPPAKRKFLIGLLKKLNELVDLREKLMGKRSIYADQIDERYRKAEIRVTGVIEAGSTIKVGDVTLVTNAELDGGTFRLVGDNVERS